MIVQIGANDGISRDPVYPIVSKYPCRALLIDPIPANVDLIKQLHARKANVSVHQLAISEQASQMEMHVPICGQSNLGSQIASFYPNHVRRLGNLANSQIETLIVPAMSLAEFLSSQEVTTVDILVFDTEGHDFPILEQALKLPCQPKILYFEHSNMSQSEKHRAREELRRNNYEFVELVADCLAIKSEIQH